MNQYLVETHLLELPETGSERSDHFPNVFSLQCPFIEL
jgi:hypothetical protein